MESRNLAIGVLAIIAAVLLVGLIIVNVQPQPAYASNISSNGGDFTVTVGRITRDTEVLYVLDNVTQRLLVYTINRTTGAIDMMDGAELGALTPPGGTG
ncbi:MAG TPA: hypothetical protein P5572_11180, partial [Phycisphaerae bacterium]|nr:hypothetical protein [Phycisphaerae bacterium]